MVPERSQARANPARGIALIATAVIVGIFLFRSGWEDGGSVSADGTDDTPAGEGSAGGEAGEGAATTAATVPVRAPSEVMVRVLNASGVSGAAASHSDTLAQAGYQMVEAGNAPDGTDPATTVVLHAAGYEREAAEAAAALGAAPTSIAPIANPPQVDPAGAHLVVILGVDVAG